MYVREQGRLVVYKSAETDQRRPESAKVHKLHQRYILISLYIVVYNSANDRPALIGISASGHTAGKAVSWSVVTRAEGRLLPALHDCTRTSTIRTIH